MANLPRDAEYIEQLKNNGIDINAYPIEIVLRSFYDYTLSQTNRFENAIKILEKYKENE